MKRQDRGGALLLALVVVTIGSLVALAVIEVSTASYSRAYRATARQRLRDACEAGIERAKYELIATQTLDQTINGTVGLSSYKVVLSQVNTPSWASVQAVSTATYDGQTLTVTRILGPGFHVARPFDYAIAANDNFDAGSVVTTGSGGTKGDIRTNNRVKWPYGGTVNGNLLVGTNIDGPPNPTVAGTTTVGAPQLPFPPIDYNYYKSIAGKVNIGNLNTTLLSLLTGSPAIVYVEGNLTLTGGAVATNTVIVVTGTFRLKLAGITVVGNAKIFVLANSITTDSIVGSTTGFYYAPAGTFTNNGTITITGGVAAKQVSLGGDLNVTLDPSLRDDADLGYNLQLPGY